MLAQTFNPPVFAIGMRYTSCGKDRRHFVTTVLDHSGIQKGWCWCMLSSKCTLPISSTINGEWVIFKHKLKIIDSFHFMCSPAYQLTYSNYIWMPQLSFECVHFVRFWFWKNGFSGCLKTGRKCCWISQIVSIKDHWWTEFSPIIPQIGELKQIFFK